MDIITGTPSNVTTLTGAPGQPIGDGPLTATVSAIADNGGGLWRVTTSAPHLFGDGDYVELAVTISATAVEAFGFIAVIDATTFDVAGTTYTATGTGTATDLSLTPQIQIPTDGDSFSLQLSGMLSALQALADRTQALRYLQVSRAMTVAFAVASGRVPIPPWATYLLVIGCGGGGGAGGGPGGAAGTANRQLAAGSGGAGARRVLQLLQVVGGATSIDVVIGAGGTGGVGGSGGASPNSGQPGTDGGSTTATWHDGFFAGTTFATLLGGSGGGGGASGPWSSTTTQPVFTPGGRGPAGLFRAGPAGLLSQLAPGYRQLLGIQNSVGTLSAPGGAWPTEVFTDPVGQMDYQEGGASVAYGLNSSYPAALSYAGAPSPEGLLGGSAGGNGTFSSTYPGGAGGGGGGAGGGGAGGAGGRGGNANSAGNGTNGIAGASAAANSGGGGGGGGGGGNASGTAGDGQPGGGGGSGFLELVFLGISTTP